VIAKERKLLQRFVRKIGFATSELQARIEAGDLDDVRTEDALREALEAIDSALKVVRARVDRG
jgi:hypothetical protein